MTSVLGVNVGHGERPAPALLREAGCWAVRFVLEPHRDDREYIYALWETAGIETMAVLARESFRDEPRGPHLREYAGRYQACCRWVQVGNEPDLDSPSSWTMNQASYRRLVEETREAMPDAYLVGAGLAGGWPLWVGGMPLHLLNAVAVHPYGRTPDGTWGTFAEGGWGFGAVGDLIDQYAEYGLPLIISEYGAPSYQLGSRSAPIPHWHPRTVPPAARGRRNWDRFADYIGGMTAALRDHPAVEAAYQFAWSDAVPGFGLHRADGSRKPAYEAFRREALRQEVAVPDQPAFNIGPGFRAVIERHGLVPQGDETYLTPDLSVMPTDRAALYYLKRANEVKLVWWDTVG